MEFSPKVTRIGQALLAVFLAVLGGTIWLEGRSDISAALRSGERWLCELDFVKNEAGVDNYLLILQPSRRSVDIVEIGDVETAAVHDKALLSDVLPDIPAAKRLDLPEGPQGPHWGPEVDDWRPSEAALAARDWLLYRTQGLGFWRWWFDRILGRERIFATAGMPLFDQFLLAAELHRMDPRLVRTAWLPRDATDRRVLYGRILSPEPRSSGGKETVEILNATGRAGVASTATDILRSQGVDVVNVGNWSGPAAGRTIVYDRTGRVEDALAVREKLGCDDAAVVTQIAPKKLVDVSVILADDCTAPQKGGLKWNWSKF